jgi:hypothetical protein
MLAAIAGSSIESSARKGVTMGVKIPVKRFMGG